MLDQEVKYFRKSIFSVSIIAIIAMALIVSFGIFALTYSNNPSTDSLHLDLEKQTLKTSSNLAEIAYRISDGNSVRNFDAINDYLGSSNSFSLQPNIPFEDINFENIPALYYKQSKICPQNDDDKSLNFASNLKIKFGSDIMFYQRVNTGGDMILLCSSLNNLPENFKLKYINASGDNSSKTNFISKIFKGQVFHSIQNLNGTIYTISFKKISNKSGIVIGMIAVLSKLSAYIDFESQALATDFHIFDIYSSNFAYSKKENSDIDFNTLAWADSVANTFNYESNSTPMISKNRTCYYDSRLNCLLIADIPVYRADTTNYLRKDGLRMVFAAFAFTVIIIIFMTIRRTDRFGNWHTGRQENITSFLKNIIEGRFTENENELALLMHSNTKGAEICCPEMLNLFRKINHSIAELENDKSDLTDILEAKMIQMNNISNKLDNFNSETNKIIELSSDKFSDLSVRMSQVANSIADLSLYDTINELSSKLHSDPSTEIIRKSSQNLRIKSVLINDKVDKIFNELNVVKKIADHAYLISINSAIFAEKANSNKLSVLSDEVLRLSVSLTNSSDQVYYLLSETRNATNACSGDIDIINETLNSGPSPSDVSDIVVEFTRLNEKISNIAMRFEKIHDEGRTLLTLIERSKSSLEKTNPIIRNLKNIANEI